ncbi:GNAT family N-acetyltransferase [Oleomonas cavernae]|uniref:GNAT family N-acetyltransferase n=1 Tax=Oleomonas cavernae TaxID=2320859 RepID=UPI001314DBB5|nr:GNAT family N-acetyltransferase [Oleomonas cavernae]
MALRPLRADDSAAIAAQVSDFEVARWTARIPHPYPPGAADAFLLDAAATDAAGATLHRAVTRAGDDSLVGIVSLVMIRPGVAELGYWVGRVAWGQGIAGAAAAAMIGIARDQGIYRLLGKVMDGNPRSMAVLARQGFVTDHEAPPEEVVRDGQRTLLHSFVLDLTAGGQGA